MDDTLYLERDYVHSGFRAVGHHLQAEYGISGFADIAWNFFLEGKRGHIFDECIKIINPSNKFTDIQELVSIYRNHTPTIELANDAKHLLGQIQPEISLGLITDGPQQSQFAKIKALGINQTIEHIIVTDAQGPGWTKPSDLAFLHIESLTGNSGEECVYIADNPNKDFIAPKKLGWKSVMVCRPGSLYSSNPGGTRADFSISDLSRASLDSISLKIV